MLTTALDFTAGFALHLIRISDCLQLTIMLNCLYGRLHNAL